MAKCPFMLVDGDVVVYRVAAACTEETDFDGEVMRTLNRAEAESQLGSYVNACLDAAGVQTAVLCFSDPDPDANWRKKILPSYKENRRGKEKPLGYFDLVTWAEEQWRTMTVPTLEADDILGMEATRPRDTDPPIICTVDKDLQTVPGLHMNPTKLDDGVWEIGEEEADRLHLMQTLTGDSSDNYKGCPGIGPKRAATLLAQPGAGWVEVLAAFGRAGLTAEDALVQAQVARILRWGEFDWKTGTVIPWSPNGR